MSGKGGVGVVRWRAGGKKTEGGYKKNQLDRRGRAKYIRVFKVAGSQKRL